MIIFVAFQFLLSGNLLSCVNEILPSICNNATELLGFSDSKIHRDIHCKCNQLLLCLILRGCPLPALYKIFKNGLENVAAFGNRIRSIAPWITFVCPELQLSSAGHLTNIPDGFAIMLELKVLVAQPQPNYPLLLHVLTMRNYKVLYLGTFWTAFLLIPFGETKAFTGVLIITTENLHCGEQRKRQLSGE